MLNAALLLLCQSMFWSLHLAGGSGSFPRPLTAEEERQYLELCAKGDLDARNVLVERNLRLVAHIIKKYYTQAEEQEDLISIGTIGLIKAVNTFKADKGIRLATYASRCIENEILMYFRRTKKLQGEVSLNEAIETDGDGAELSIGDVVGKSDTMLEDLQDKDDRALVRRLVAERLTEREADVIRRRYGLEDRVPQTQRQVAAAYKISRSYVSRIEKKALGKLEEALREYW
jgi:RNA polymerase sporulation-specific sigma factor